MSSNEAIGKVIVGNSDSLIFLGGEAQGKLRDFSQSLAQITLRDNDKIELLIEEIIAEMDKLPSVQEKRCTSRLFITKSSNQSRIISKYSQLLTYIDQITIALQLQEAQLLKDNALLKSMKLLLCETSLELEQCLRKGDELRSRPMLCREENASIISFKEGAYDAIWEKRLDKRIEDITVSHTLALQMLTQIELMRENNSQLLERLSSALSGTIPIWITQITLILGIENRCQRRSVQKKLEQNLNNLGNHNHKKPPCISSGNGSTPTYDTGELANANCSLQSSFRSLEKIEQDDDFLRHEMLKTLDK